MKKITTILLCAASLAVFSTAQAQTTDTAQAATSQAQVAYMAQTAVGQEQAPFTTMPWTLGRCIGYAIDHNINVASQRVNAELGELDVNSAKNQFLPQLNGYGSQSFSFGRGLTSDNTYANRNTSSFAVGAQLQMPIFQGLRAMRQLSYSRTSLAAMLEQVEAAKDDVTLNVIGQYLQALYAREMVEVARTNLNISRTELERRQAMIEAGRLPELDIHEARSQVARDELSLTNALNDSVMAILDLAQLLNLPDNSGFDIMPLEDAAILIPDPGTVFANALAYNHTLRAGQLQVEAAERNVKLAQSGYIPTLSFNAGLSTNYYKTSGFANEGFGAQMRHNFGQSIGFSLSVPIFDAFSTRNNVRRARLRQESARLQLDDSRNNLYKAIVQAHTQAVGAMEKEKSAAVAVESTQAAFEAMQVKYDNGRANSTELETARQNYISSLAQSVQARYERILRARILEFYNTSTL
ncbi:MAG: TolC family protein [Muribaculaceae bacterium]|nr:TolC family protein [Muribaculaceae bacterium]